MTLLVPAWILLAACLAGLALWWGDRWRRDSWHRIMAPDVLAYLRPGGLGRAGINLPLLIAALTALALSGPARIADNQKAFLHAEGWLVAIDVSKSMQTDDIAPNRLAAARDVAAELAIRAGGRPVALVVFAGDAYLAAPFAFDKRPYQAYLAALKPGTVPIDGSNVRRALALTSNVMDESGLLRGRVFLLTDGPDIHEDAVAMGRRLARSGHRLDVLTFADPATSDPEPVDVEAADRLAETGGGVHQAIGLAGRLPETVLAENAGDLGLIAAPLTTVRQINQSHWLLLLMAPLFLFLFRRVTA
ncbi:MAG: VWA domain-containing protein [Pseudomonadota bacterium]